VLDTWSRQVVGWSIEAAPSTRLVTNTLGTALDQRRLHGETIIHSDQGHAVQLLDVHPSG
jgi:transposase InsO family protein